MSVDYYGCKCCGRSIYEEFVGTCTKCEQSVCTNCVVNDDVNSSYAYEYGVKVDGTKEQMEEYGFDESYGYEIGDIIDDTGIAPKYCPFCSGNQVSEGMLLDYALTRLGMNYKDLKQEYLNNKEND